MGIECIVGLRNPGAEYAKTRHNVGAWFVDALAESVNANFKLEKRFRSVVAKFSLDGHECWLLKPTTYMNESGTAVAAFARFYQIPVEKILVAHDELDFDAGVVRLKKAGGHGGHNGLRDVIAHITAEFYRLRIGIAHPGHRDDVTDYVLGVPSRADRDAITRSIQTALEIVPKLLSGKIQQAMHVLHSESDQNRARSEAE